jgi:hypothetical protein
MTSTIAVQLAASDRTGFLVVGLARRRKLVMEIAGRMDGLSLAGYVAPPKSRTDCEDISEHAGR